MSKLYNSEKLVVWSFVGSKVAAWRRSITKFFPGPALFPVILQVSSNLMSVLEITNIQLVG